MNNRPSIAVIICAAGASTRMNGVKKEYRVLENVFDADGKPLTVLGAVVTAFASSPRIDSIVITVPADPENGEGKARQCLPACFLPRVSFAAGGVTRRASVHNALSFLAASHPDYALIHDGARPWIDRGLIERVMDAVVERKAVIPVLPLIETPKEIDENGFIKRHLRRASIGTAQTPQAFAFPEILAAHEKAAERELRDRVDYTDDAEVWGEFRGAVAVIRGSPANKKITFPEDFF
jgi:2-C-methyl-D-erythritol 4-phosphate cytidylyltransferase/2-C-methyl-D-erythritol 4-phosphate cytidylyltransferase/2-C-methyl-D-erythritol 2,4-cyclodiphosphate synthase